MTINTILFVDYCELGIFWPAVRSAAHLRGPKPHPAPAKRAFSDDRSSASERVFDFPGSDWQNQAGEGLSENARRDQHSNSGFVTRPVRSARFGRGTASGMRVANRRVSRLAITTVVMPNKLAQKRIACFQHRQISLWWVPGI